MEYLPLDTLTGKVRGTSSDTGELITKPIDFSDVFVKGIDFADSGQRGITPLVSGQSYVDVVFPVPEESASWILTGCSIMNAVDATPLNLMPGIITSKTTTGFRLQLNGLPNTDNYDLHWAIGSPGGGPGGGAATDFLGLTDTPNSYLGKAAMGVTVNAAATGLEFTVAAAGGMGSPNFINVLDYGAKADCVTLFDITMPNGNVVTSAAHTFVEADIGKWTIIRGATDPSGKSPLIAKITAVSGHTATLDVTNTSNLTAVYSDSFPRMDFGTDNTIPFVNACNAVPGPGQRYIDFGTPFAGTGVMNPVLPGDGGTVYIPRGQYLLINGFPGFPASNFWYIVTNNIVIKGDGIGQTTLFMTSDARCTKPIWGSVAWSHGLFQNWIVTDFTVYDLCYFTGGGNSLDIRGVNNLLVQRIEICNSRGNGGINYQGYPTGGGTPMNNRVAIRDCWVHGKTEDGYTPMFPHSIEGDGMNVGEVGDVHIEGNTIERPGRHAYEGGGMCRDQYFYGNTIDMGNGGLSGINPTGGSTTVVMGNTVKNVPGGSYAIDFTVDVGAFLANDIRCIGNYVHGNMQAGFRFQNTSGDLASEHLDRILVANNWVQGNTNVSTAGILIGGGAGEHPSMMITGNWFGNLGFGLTSVSGLNPATGKWIIVRGNAFAASGGQPVDDNCLAGNCIVEDNVMPAAAANRYGSKGMSCNIDGNNVLAGATYSNTAIGLDYRTTDSVEVIRGATTAGGLIIWAQVTAVNTITTYAYNPTGGTLNTGGATKYILHRLLP